MSKSYNQRQRKKLHLAEFQELGFLVNFQFAEGTAIETVDEIVDRFINEVIQPNGLAYEGSGYLHWEGLVCLEKIGKCDESHRETVKKWLETNGLQQIEVSEVFDIWWEYPAKAEEFDLKTAWQSLCCFIKNISEIHRTLDFLIYHK